MNINVVTQKNTNELLNLIIINIKKYLIFKYSINMILENIIESIRYFLILFFTDY